MINANAAANRYTANGTTTAFAYTFEIADENAIEVLVDATVKVIDLDYSVSGVGEDTGGSVTFISAPAANAVVTLLRLQPAEQQSSYQQNEPFPNTRVESDLDLLAMQIQQVREWLGRALTFAKSSTLTDQHVDAPITGLYARAKAGGGIEWVLPALAGALTSPVPIADGGTAATTAAGARANLLLQSTVTQQGIVELATVAEALTGTDTARATTPEGVAAVVAAASVGQNWTTGDVKLTLKTTADSTWVLMDDKSIGDATSGATGRANADCLDLYTLLWNNIIDQWAPVVGGRGANAAADFNGHKAMALPKALGRALAGYGTGTVIASGTDGDVDITANDFTVLTNVATWVTGMPVVFTLGSGTISGLTSTNTYYIIRESATKVKLASTLANAQKGTAIDFTAKSSPVWTLTHTYTARALGEQLGEMAHAQTSTELLIHTHALSLNSSDTLQPDSAAVNFTSANNQHGVNSPLTTATGGNAAMNIMQPTVFLNTMIKL